MCIGESSKGKPCTREIKKDGACARHYVNKTQINKHTGKVNKCPCPEHKFSSSPYHPDFVPLENFLKPNKPDTNIYSHCSHCREIARNKRKEGKIKKDLECNKDGFQICSWSSHEKINGSSRFKVPVELFDNPDKPESPFKICKLCRDFNQKEKKEKKILAEKEGKFSCGNCHHPFQQDERALNLDGTPSSLCKVCKNVKKDYDKNSYLEWKKMYRDIQFEIMLERETCCQVCNSIFLIPEEGKKYHRQLSILIEDGIRSVIYKDQKYLVKDFLREFQHLIEFRIVDYDHLPENDQRERHIILDGEEFIKKTKAISSMSTEKEIRAETKGCQIACCKCHLIVTILRESGDYIPSAYRKEKQDFVNSIKREIGGCTTCGFYDESLLRFLEFNHIDPENKIEDITRMIKSKKFSIEDIQNEIIKTLLTCKCCHRIYTNWQIQEGILNLNKQRY